MVNKPLRKLLVGVDFSEGSDIALAHARAIATRFGAELVLVHACIVPGRDQAPKHFQGFIGEYERAVREEYEHASQRLEQLRDRLADDGLEVSMAVVNGPAEDAIPDAVADLGADLVVVGSHGRTGFRRFLLGSCAERVIRVCEADVLVARDGGVGGEYHKLLVPIDFTDYTPACLKAADAFAAGDGSTMNLLYAWQRPTTGLIEDNIASLSAYLGQSLRQYAANRGRELLDELGNPDNVTYDHVEASPSVAIAMKLDEGDYDLVVMGGHGRRGIKRWLVGSVAETTARHAPCSVLVVHRLAGR